MNALKRGGDIHEYPSYFSFILRLVEFKFDKNKSTSFRCLRSNSNGKNTAGVYL